MIKALRDRREIMNDQLLEVRGVPNMEIEVLSEAINDITEIIIQHEKLRRARNEELRKKCQTCTSPHCGMCDKWNEVIKG